MTLDPAAYHAPYIVIISVGCTLAIIGLAVYLTTRFKAAASWAGGICLAVAAWAFLTLLSATPDETEMLRAAAADRYGITLTDAQVSQLGYPTETPEPGTSVTYGKTLMQIGDRWAAVSLVWTGEEMRLVEVTRDGRPSVELSTRGRGRG